MRSEAIFLTFTRWDYLRRDLNVLLLISISRPAWAGKHELNFFFLLGISHYCIDGNRKIALYDTFVFEFSARITNNEDSFQLETLASWDPMRPFPIIFSYICSLNPHEKNIASIAPSATMAVHAQNFTIAQLEQYGNVPALPPHPGVVPDFAAHNERADVYKVLCSILLAILYVFLCLRLYAKVWIKRIPGFDDCETCVFLKDWRIWTDWCL